MFTPRISLVVLVLGLAVLVPANETVENTTEKVVPEPTIPSSSVSPTSSTSKPTTKPTTTKPTTTTEHPTTTIKPTTTPVTTTAKPNTTTTPATTPKPTEPTTPPAPITTPKPSPPEEGTWEVISSGNNSCIVLHMMAFVDVYQQANNQTSVVQYSIPKDANATGNCGDAEQKIKLSWACAYNKTAMDSVEFVFKKNNTLFDLETVNLKIFTNNTTTPLDINRTKEEFSTPIKMSYKCKKGQSLNFTNAETKDIIASLHISNVQFQAFGNISEHTFAEAKDCEPYETPDIVPIAVGCALTALIVFVLIGYLIGRRRNQARGYLSM